MEDSGKLELTWTNKHLRLLADESGGYTWVPPSDYRVSEVRRLHDIETVGETCDDRSRAKGNLLIRGDALNRRAKADRELATDAPAAKSSPLNAGRTTSRRRPGPIGGEIDVAEARGSWAALKQLSR